MQNEKSFEACGSLDELTEEMCVTIAGQACLLLVNGRCGVYDKLTTILVYEDMYSAGAQQNQDGTVGKGGTRLGESWEKGTVILSWKHSLRGPAIANDGQNLVIHEFAHQLDQWDGVADGAPLRAFVNEHKDWSKNFQEAFEKHAKRLKAGRKLVIDSYGATDPAEADEGTLRNLYAASKGENAVHGSDSEEKHNIRCCLIDVDVKNARRLYQPRPASFAPRSLLCVRKQRFLF